jgi:hypothetical protein
VIVIATTPYAHHAGDAAAWIAAALVARWQHHRWPGDAAALIRHTAPDYFLWLGVGALAGAWLFGSTNSLRALAAAPSHSVAGALAGGILGVELWKYRHGVRRSTGGAFVLSICIGIAIGRLGCLFSGLDDFTYGTPTALPWAVELGDGVGRHPVQLYESLTMMGFAAIYLGARFRGRRWATEHAFHAMIMVYAVQRFAWEWFKPYPPLIGPFNIFHALMLGLFIYAIFWWRRADIDDASAGDRVT